MSDTLTVITGNWIENSGARPLARSRRFGDLKRRLKPSVRHWTTIAFGLVALIVSGCSGEVPTESTASSAVLRVEAIPCVGRVNQLATAVLVSPNQVLTVAHTFEGTKRIDVRSSSGSTVEAEIAYLDEAKDIALLSLPPDWLSDSAAPLSFGSPSDDEPVSVVSFASPDGPVIKSGQVTRLVSATLDGEGRRSAIKLDADIEAGDSGAPVINPSGQIVGMVFATERGTDRGWAIAAQELTSAIDDSKNGLDSTSLGCS